MSITVAFVVLVLLSLMATDARAQIVPEAPQPSDARMRVGPFWLTPSISLTNAGVDTNVFYDPDSGEPRSDLTLTLSPQSSVWLPMGRTWIVGNIREDLVWFKRYASERSADHNYTLAWIVPMSRMSFTLGGGWLSTRARPGFEIDARSDRSEAAFNGAVEFRALSRTRVGLRAEYRDISFDSDAVFLGRNLRDLLNRMDALAALTIQHDLTPLTTVSLQFVREGERFDFTPERNANSTRVNLGLRFDPFALVSGSLQVGVRDFSPHSADVPGYTGLTAAINLAYVALESTRVSVAITRDLEHSFQIDQPYYVWTGVSGSARRHIYGPFDIEARIGAQRLAYRERAGAVVAISNRVDGVRTYGIGVGYRLGGDLRLGVNIDRQQRTSGVVSRQYRALRSGISVTYGS